MLVTYLVLRDHNPRQEKGIFVLMQYNYVYVLYNSETNEIKLGHTKDFNRRLRELKVESKSPLLVLAVIREQLSLEDILLDRFNHLLTKDREWFRADVELVNFVNDLHERAIFYDKCYDEKLISLPEPPKTMPYGGYSVKAGWNKIREFVPESFTRRDVEKMAKCHKTRAVALIRYAKDTGQIKEISRGKYIKVTKENENV